MLFILLNACVERVDFKVPSAQLRTTIEGLISDSPGPYFVKISEGINLNADSLVRVPVTNAKITLHDDEGNIEEFLETSQGDYSTGGVIRGKVGHRYYIHVETADGKIFESEPDKITSVGEVENIRFEYETRSVEEKFGIVSADIFNIYIDSKGFAIGEENYVRWRFTGTYKVLTYPELHFIWSEGFILPDPYPCSGYAFIGRTYAEKVHECTCCECWANNYESAPQLSDAQLVSNGVFKNVKVGEVPISSATFYEKYNVRVEQMSLSKTAFEFFKAVRSQKNGATSLFQPPSGEIKGNVKSLNSSPVIGIFWASSIRTKSVFINRSDVPYPLTPIAQIRYPCTWYKNSSTDKPAFWD